MPLTEIPCLTLDNQSKLKQLKKDIEASTVFDRLKLIHRRNQVMKKSIKVCGTYSTRLPTLTATQLNGPAFKDLDIPNELQDGFTFNYSTSTISIPTRTEVMCEMPMEVTLKEDAVIDLIANQFKNFQKNKKRNGKKKYENTEVIAVGFESQQDGEVTVMVELQSSTNEDPLTQDELGQFETAVQKLFADRGMTVAGSVRNRGKKSVTKLQRELIVTQMVTACINGIGIFRKPTGKLK
eukprot:TRINITY_DN3155_c0_g1_i1.p1 TRINITY_DN3155_c0_g1~~TRINITY_DN3155_c0_g1_i1.p1  ORF type:complete len:238 (+),score=54.84 TRINITY_DN3155_c0_g1_i1:1109-1822(+)